MTDEPFREHYLTRAVLARSERVPLSADEFVQLREARRLVAEALSVEERIGLVWDNYVEYESFLLRGALEWMVHGDQSWAGFNSQLHSVNRLVMNLLSACRTYLDQTRHFASTYFGRESEEFEQAKAWASEQHSSTPGFRVMEALRNFAQHRGRAVHMIVNESWWVEEERRVSRSSLRPVLVPQRLREDGGFQKAALKELEDMGEQVDLRPLLKEYISGISIVHEKLRDLLKNRVEKAEELLAAAIERYRVTADGNVLGLAAVEADAGGKWGDQVHIFADLYERRRSLRRRYRTITNLPKHFATNEPK